LRYRRIFKLDDVRKLLSFIRVLKEVISTNFNNKKPNLVLLFGIKAISFLEEEFFISELKGLIILFYSNRTLIWTEWLLLNDIGSRKSGTLKSLTLQLIFYTINLLKIIINMAQGELKIGSYSEERY